MGPTAVRRDEALHTLERSILMAPVQRRGLAVMLLAMIASVGSIGLMSLLPLVFGFASFLVIKAHPVQRRLRVWSLGAVWGFGEAAIGTAVLLADSPPEYLISMLAVPTILGSVVWPKRWVVVAACGTMVLMLGVGAVADPVGFTHHPERFFMPAMTAAVLALLTLVARAAEASFRAETAVDPLTGVANRHALTDRRSELGTAGPVTPLAVLVVDVDSFKQVNDRHGHATGDRVLRAVASTLVGVAGDVPVYRYGGEEFVLVLEGAMAFEATLLAERMRAAVEAGDTVDGVGVTVSVGVAARDPLGHDDFDALFAKADRRLYSAKRTGRNRVVSHDGPGGGGPAETVGRPALTDGGGTPSRRSDALRRRPSIRAALDRSHLIDMTERLHRWNPVAYVLMGAITLAFAGAMGPFTAVPGVGAGAFYRFTQRTVRRWRRPDLVLGGVWAAAQLCVATSVVISRVPALWALTVLVLMVVANSAAFPIRHVVIGTTYTAILIVGAALLVDPHVFTRSPEAVSVALAVLITAAISGGAVGRVAVEMSSAAAHDALTGLPNRSACTAHASRLMRLCNDRWDPFAVIIGDLDHFKAVNDSLGHAQGDRVLVALVERMSERLRDEATLFRLGGEEFCILASGVDRADATAIAERLRAAVAARPLAGSPVTISFGVAVAGPADGLDHGGVFRRADTALYEAKAMGRNRVCAAQTPGAGVEVPQGA